MDDKNRKHRLRKGLIILASSLFLLAEVVQANTFVFNPKNLQWQAINSSGKVVRTGHGSGGKSYCADVRRSCRTPTGTFHVIGKGGAGCRSSRYPLPNGGASMAWCMHFSKHYAIHGSYDVPNHNASHGCIRVRTSEAKWLSANFMSVGTTVQVKPY